MITGGITDHQTLNSSERPNQEAATEDEVREEKSDVTESSP